MREEDPRATDYAQEARRHAVEKLKTVIRGMDIELEFHSIMGEKETIKLHNSNDPVEI